MHARSALVVLGAGLVAGLAVLALDEGLGFLTLGYWIVLPARLVGAYLAMGVAAALAIELVRGLRGIRSGGWAHTTALSAALVYLGPVIERFYGTAEFRGLSPAVCTAIAAVGVVGYVIALVVLRRVAGPRNAWLAPAAATVAVAIGLALNRNVFFSSTAPRALVADAVVVGLAFGVALLARAGRTLQLSAAGLAAVATVALFVREYDVRSTRLVAAGSGPEHPDLVVVLIDTLRYDVFRSVVDETAEGRRFREAVGAAVWFDNLIAAAPWTAPSVASIMTGLYPKEHGFDRLDPNLGPKSATISRLADNVPTLAERLSGEGYWTDAIVTNQAIAPSTGMARGFDRYEIISDPTMRLPVLSALINVGLGSEKAYASAEDVRRRLASHLPEIVATEAPVFLYLHLLDPHAPLNRHPQLPPDPAGQELPEIDRLYRDETRYALDEVATMIGLLRETPRWQRTLLVVLSDHGEMLPSDGHRAPAPDAEGHPQDYGHGFALYESLLRVPLVIRPPGGLPRSIEVDEMLSHVDLHDTIVEALGLEVPRIGRDRVSAASWLDGDGHGGRLREQAVSGSVGRGPRQRALRVGGMKLIEFPDGDFPNEVYDLTRDPRERRNLAPERGGFASQARRTLDRFYDGLGAAAAAESVEVTPEMQKQLEALGYLDE